MDCQLKSALVSWCVPRLVSPPCSCLPFPHLALPSHCGYVPSPSGIPGQLGWLATDTNMFLCFLHFSYVPWEFVEDISHWVHCGSIWPVADHRPDQLHAYIYTHPVFLFICLFTKVLCFLKRFPANFKNTCAPMNCVGSSKHPHDTFLWCNQILYDFSIDLCRTMICGTMHWFYGKLPGVQFLFLTEFLEQLRTLNAATQSNSWYLKFNVKYAIIKTFHNCIPSPPPTHPTRTKLKPHGAKLKQTWQFSSKAPVHGNAPQLCIR